MRHIPLADRVIATPCEEQRVLPSGLFVPDAATHNKHVAFATVEAVGAGRINAEGKVVPLTVKVGDVICYPRKAPALIPVIDEDGGERTVLLLREAEIVSIVEGLPHATPIVGLDGRVLAINPRSRAIPDSAYQSQEEMQVAVREGWAEPDEIDPLPEMPS